jgi:hypothetical protein
MQLSFGLVAPALDALQNALIADFVGDVSKEPASCSSPFEVFDRFCQRYITSERCKLLVQKCGLTLRLKIL